MRQLMQDLRYAVRMWRRARCSRRLRVLTLALGIGGNTAIFSVVNAVLLKTASLLESKRTLRSCRKNRRIPGDVGRVPEFRGVAGSESNICTDGGVPGESFSLAAGGKAEHVRAREASASFLTLLGVRPFLGRQLPARGRSRGSCAGWRFWDMGCGRRSSAATQRSWASQW